MARNRWPSLRLIPFDSPQELIQALLDKNVVAVIEEIPVMDSLLSQMGMRGEISLKSSQLETNGVHSAIPQERNEIINWIEDGFSQITPMELGELERRWISDSNKRIYFDPQKKETVQQK